MLTNYTIDGFENIKYQGFGKLKFIQNRLADLFERFGYCQVETPTFEAYDFYTDEDAINGDELFKLISSSGKILALKPDATLPVARMAAINHRDPEELIKFSYQTNVYKDFTGSASSKKETTQAGIEYFGNSDPACDGEVIALAITALRSFGVENIHIDLGHVGFINALLDELYLNRKDRERLFDYIENKNIGDIKEFLKNRTDISDRHKEILIALPRLYGEPEETFEKMEALSVNPKMTAVVERLKTVYDYLKTLGLEKYIHFDIGFTNRMSYYTGIIFKGYLDALGETVISGGRYDSLSSKFGIDRPACGFSLDLILLLDYLNQKNLLPENGEPKFILLYDPEKRQEAFEICNQVRSTGRSAEMFALDRRPEELVGKINKNSHYEGAQIRLLSETLSEWNGKTFEEVEVSDAC